MDCRCGEMADAQDLKLKNWPFFGLTFHHLTSDDLLVFTGENSRFARPFNTELVSLESGTKSGTHTFCSYVNKLATTARFSLNYFLCDGVL